MFGGPEIFERVAGADRASLNHVGIEPAAVDKSLEYTRLGEPLEVTAWVAELRDDCFDLADADAVTEKIVQRGSARHDVAADLVGLQVDPRVRLQILDRLGLE